MKTIYTAKASTTGGRSGHSKTDDGVLDLHLGKAEEAGKTNPEQLFACGYSACFGSALEMVAKKEGLDASGAVVSATVHLNEKDGGYSLSVEMDVELPNISQNEAMQLVSKAHQVCPYSKATRGNIDVKLSANNTKLEQQAA